jgi:pimeloyl-ACP methyl ester carboxylesterase
LSTDGPRPRDGRQIAAELRRALELAGLRPPYVLVGASLGGPYVRVFAGLYPDDVAALVLVDPTPDIEDFEELGDTDVAEFDAWPATRAQMLSSSVPPAVPVFLIDARERSDVPFATGAVRESRFQREQQLSAESLAYAEWLAGIPGGELIVTERSGHNVAIEQPELVVTTIRRAVDIIRAKAARSSDL